MRFVNIITDKDDASSIASKTYSSMIQDPARGDFFTEVEEIPKKTYHYEKESRTQLFSIVEDPDHVHDNYLINNFETYGAEAARSTNGQLYPSIIKARFIDTKEAASMIFSESKGRWISESAEVGLESTKFTDFTKKVNAELLKQYADFSSAGKLVELLEKIPNFKLKLTDQERDVIGQNGNVLVIGRSGTGKTTCAILRMFSMEILFKIRLTLYKNKHEGILRDTRFTADDIDKTIGLHCVFVTASPVLTNEVRRYYEKLTKQIKVELFL
jgi:hypothetical protein